MKIENNINSSESGVPVDYNPFNPGVPVDYDPFMSGNPVDYDPFAVELEAVVPATAMQMEIWLSTLLGDDASCAYNESCTLYFKGLLDRKALHAAIQDVVQRHQSLRATFTANGEQMCISKTVAIDLPEDKFPDDERFGEAMKQTIANEVSIAFDLQNGPLLRVRLVRKNNLEHYLLLTAHHIVCDGWSLENIINDLGEFYTAHVNGEVCRLEPPPQYGDYATAIRSEFAQVEQRKAREYWLKVLSGQIPDLDLPLDKPRPKHRSFSSARVDHTIPPDLVRKLQLFGANRHASLFVVLLTALQVLLYRLTNQTDIITGVSYAGHLQPGLTDLVGHCVSLLPIRGRLESTASFDEILEQLRQRMLDTHIYSKCSYGDLIPELNITRQSNRIPLISVIFGFYKMDVRIAQNFKGLRTQFSINPRTNENFELFVSTIEIQGKVVFETQYNTDLFDGETIARWLKCFETLLEAAIEQADTPIAELPLMDELSIRHLIYDWNETQKTDPKAICLHQLFERQVLKTPDNVAVVFEGETLSYSELNEKSNQVAHYLRKQGVGPDVLVGVLMERSFEMIVGLLGILKAGGAYVPIDPSYPKDRILFMLKDSQVQVLLTQHQQMESLPDYNGHFVFLDTGWSGLANESRQNPENLNNVTDLSYVIYTSGSTGTPKGVMVEHGNVLRLFSATDPWFHFDADDVWTLFHSFAFDFSVWEIWGALLYGGRLVIVPQIVSRSPEEFYQLLCREKVTILNQTPSAFRQLMNAQAETMKSHSLRKIIFGGEALEVRHLKPWYERNGTQQTQLVNMYGITETTVHVTYRPLTPVDTKHLGASPIGARIPDLRLYILDAHHQPVPVGVTGEIYVGGEGVARGYLNRPELTAERFLPDPFAQILESNARMYKTGDLGKWLSDGTIEYVGRNDFQVKIRGFRIELGEIEAKLAAISGIGEAVVLVREDIPGDKRMVAYYTVKDKAVSREFTAEALRHSLSSQLPDYMLPSAYMAIERFPLTPNGKTDRKALPAPEVGAYITCAYEEPIGEVEETLSQIWSEILNVEKVGRRDHFFDLGGHSLLAVKMIEQLRRKDLNTDVRSLFLKPILMDLAATIGKVKPPIQVPPNRIYPDCDHITPEMITLVTLEQRHIDHIVESTPGGASNVQDIYLLAPLQEGILIHYLLNNRSDVYLLFSFLVFETRELLDSFLAALQAVIDRNDILRTAIVWEEMPEPVQVVWRKAKLSVEQLTLDPSVGDTFGQLRSRFNRSNFRIDIRKAPMMCAYIARDDTDDRWLLVLTHHHLIGDHTSFEILNDEVRAHLTGKASLLPPPLPFRNFVAQSRLGVSRKEHEVFFSQMLNDVVEPTAPFGLLDVHGDGTDIVEAQLEIEASFSQRLRECARAMGVSAASIFHVAWARVLACLSNRDDVVFGTVLFGRMQGGVGADRVMGMFINTLPIRIGIKNEAVEQVIQKTHRLLAELLYHEHASLSLAKHCSGVQSPLPLFTSLLNYRYYSRRSPDEDPNNVWGGMKTIHAEERTNYPIVLSVNDLGDVFSLTAQTQKTIEPIRVCEFVNTVIRDMVNTLEKAPDTEIQSIEVLPPVEKQLMLFDWNATKADYPKDRCVHQLFEIQVDKTPDAVALVYEGEQLTYAELNNRSNRLAHHLISLGIKQESLVAIGVERSLEMVVGLLAVLKAGGAYVPLDPTYPSERLTFMMEDAQVEMLLTQNKLKDRFSNFAGPVVVLDGQQGTIDAESAENPTVVGSGDQLAYVMYTSGSTGTPKGVAVVHRGIVRLVKEIDYVDLSPEEVMLQFAPISFDASTFEIWGALLNGARLVIFPNHLASLQELGEVLKRYEVTTLWLTAGLFHQMVTNHLEGLKPVRQILAGGDVLSAPIVKKALEELKGSRIINGYGPTENTTFTCCHPMTDPKQVEDLVSIGRPIANTQVYILDDYLQPVPIGAVGELYIGGEGLARGYFNKPELTREKFIANPFSSEPDSKIYKSGDLVRYRLDGTIEFLGRRDTQVKIRGFRIEIGEIEATLLSHEKIKNVAVDVREYSAMDKRLLAYIVLASDASLDQNELREFVSAKLPYYMVPASFIFLEDIPLTPNGKIDRKALSEADIYSLENKSRYIKPSTPTEEMVSEIFSKVLGLQKVGACDNFFELGGDSLLALSVLTRLSDTFHLKMTLRDVFEAPTVSTMSLLIVQKQSNDVDPEELERLLQELEECSTDIQSGEQELSDG